MLECGAGSLPSWASKSWVEKLCAGRLWCKLWQKCRMLIQTFVFKKMEAIKCNVVFIIVLDTGGHTWVTEMWMTQLTSFSRFWSFFCCCDMVVVNSTHFIIISSTLANSEQLIFFCHSLPVEVYCLNKRKTKRITRHGCKTTTQPCLLLA